MKMKITIDLPSFAAGCLATAAAVPLLKLPIPAPFDFSTSAATTYAASLAALACAGTAAARTIRRKPPATRRLANPCAPPDGAFRCEPPLSPHDWLRHNRIGMSPAHPSRDDLEREIRRLLAAQLTHCDQSLASAVARLLLHLDSLQGDDAYEHAVRTVSSAAWASLSDGRQFDLAAALGSLRTGSPRASARDDERLSYLEARHAYPVTRLVAVLGGLRRRFRPADLLWLSTCDNTLWHVVDSHGRCAAFVEGLGPIAHYRAETAADAPLATPSVDVGVRALMAQIAESGYTDPAT